MAAAITPVVTIHDEQLHRTIVEKSRVCGTTVKEETRTVFKGIVRDAIAYTPPGSAGAQGKDAQRSGEAAINRDLNRMGFAPVTIKGKRTITQAWGRPIAPVTVPTKENPRFADPDAFHLARLASKHGGRVTRGGAQAFYVDRRKFAAMQKRLFAEVGKLASGWVRAAQQLGVPVPAWISRHGTGRGSDLQVVETPDTISLRVVNYFPDQAPADEMARRITALKGYALERLKRQMPYLLKKNLAA